MRGRLTSLLFATLLATSCKPSAASLPASDDSPTSPRDSTKRPEAVDAGVGALPPAEQYAALCAVCHGANGAGYEADNAPSLVNRTFLESATNVQLERSIADGRPGTSMAAYSTARGGPLSPEAITRLVGWLRRNGPAPVTLPTRPAGDKTRGEPLYAAHCAQCHGDAKARATAVHLANPRFLEVASDAFLSWAIVHGRPGTAMEAWQGKLTDTQIDDVVAFVRAFDAPPAAQTLPPPTGKEPVVLNPQGRAPSLSPRSTPCPPGKGDGGKPTCTPDERYVSVDQVKTALEQKRRIVIIDARPASDWMRVHIPGAVSIPYHDLRRLEEIPNDGTWVIAYCACPHHLSGDVVNALRARGFKHAAILDEGILEWHRRGYPVVAAPGVEPPPKESPGLSMPPTTR